MSESDAQKFLRSIEGTLEIPQAQAAPGWTSETPKVEGWYWWERNGYSGVCYVTTRLIDEFTQPPLKMDKEYQWSGPLTPPEGDEADEK